VTAGSIAAPSWSARTKNGEKLVEALKAQRDSDIEILGRVR